MRKIFFKFWVLLRKSELYIVNTCCTKNNKLCFGVVDYWFYSKDQLPVAISKIETSQNECKIWNSNLKQFSIHVVTSRAGHRSPAKYRMCVYPPIYLHLNFEIPSLKNWVWRTWFFVKFELDFCRLHRQLTSSSN